MVPMLVSLRLLSLAVSGVASAHDQKMLRLPSSAFAAPGTDASFDYVVVGGGTAGLAVASRLAEIASVAVVEAGGIYQIDNGNQSVVPVYTFSLPFTQQAGEGYPRHPLMDWDLVSEPQTGGGNRKVHYAQGKTLGGSAAINLLAYHRASRSFYDQWAESVGDDSYTFDNVLPFFKKSTKHTPPNEKKRNTPNATVFFDADAYGNGPIEISYSNFVDVSVTWIALALQSIGMPLAPKGLSSGQLAGLGAHNSATMSPDAKRSTSQTGYLAQAIETTQLVVYPQTQAIKLAIDTSGKVTGVDVSTAGLQYTLSATKEVIVSAGSFHSPQLLMVSGIGPRDVLDKHDIPVVADLPGVGQTLWDHIFFDVMTAVSTGTGSDGLSTPEGSEAAVREYLDNAAGPLSYGGGYLSFEKIPEHLRENFSDRTKALLAEYPEDWPEVEYIASSFPGGNGTLGNISGALLIPSSRGNVTISSSSMTDRPVIDMGWLTDAADEELVVAIVKRCREAWASDEVSAILVGDEVVPGQAVSTDEQILDYVRQNARTVWHATSTCLMGKEDDPMAVVDSRARVFGVSSLRVVDASIFPFGAPGHPQSTVYMLAEKIADDIINSPS